MYTPNPIDTNHIQLPPDIMALGETLAENIHETWAAKRIAEGWVYGTHRDDTLHRHPCLVPYKDLPETEKDYDRATATETLKTIIRLGFSIHNKKE